MIARPRRSALYLPASNAKAIAKARTLACDVVILDLEDAVAPDAKEIARDQAVAAVQEGGFGARELVVRVNGLETEWGAADLAAMGTCARCGRSADRSGKSRIAWLRAAFQTWARQQGGRSLRRCCRAPRQAFEVRSKPPAGCPILRGG